ncbi:MAG: sensor histidine kinase [Anaerolineales bacterium]|nr:sensor histidine kinase [Anaerolineales bacterium]
MNTNKNGLEHAMDQELHRQQVREVQPFFIIVIAVIGGMYAWVVWRTPAFQTTAILIPATLLVFVHLCLHWILPKMARIQPSVPGGRRNSLLYIALQLLIILGIINFVPDEGMLFALYLAMAGETIGISANLRQAALPVLVVLLVMGVNAVLLWGVESLPSWSLTLLPMLIFTAIYVNLFNRQVTARQEARLLVVELQKVNDQLSVYAEQVEELTIKAERKRLARELHDTLAQGLVGVILQLETVDVHLSKGQGVEAQELVQKTMERARLTLAEARRAITDLRAEVLDFADAIEDEISRFQTATGISCDVELDDLTGVPPEIVENLLRALSEGLSNIARHAHAGRVALELRRQEDWITLNLSDDGIGFSSGQVEGRSGHYGLVGLQERARLAGGTFSVSSEPAGQGTILTFRLPLDGEAAHD